jgi:hypothetical protein
MKLQVEVDMTTKITAVVTAILLASASAAFAQTNARAAQPQAAWHGPYVTDNYYNRDYWEGVAPAGRIHLHDPFVGTPFEGVAPY